MNLGPISKNTSTVEVNKSKDGIWLRDGEWESLMPYEDFPQFRKMRPDEVAKVEKPEPEQYFWPNLGLVVGRQTIEKSHDRKRGLQRMRCVALGLLVLMGVIFVIASVNIDQYPWLGYVRAFAEAAMVGALADWFAVTALFRHPLRLPIRHTNIVAERKDAIGEGLADFIKNRFLTRQVVEEFLADKDLADGMSYWLRDKSLTRELSLTLCRALRAIIDNDNGELEAFVSRNFRGALDLVNVSTLIARLLNWLVSDNHTKTLINKLVDLGQQFYDEREERIRAQVKDEATFGTKTIAGKVFDKLSRRLKKTFSEIRSDSKIRQEFDRRIKLLAWEFENDSETKERTEAYKQEFLNDPQVNEAFSSIGSALKNRFVHNLTGTKDSDPPLAKDITKLLDRLGDMLERVHTISVMLSEWSSPNSSTSNSRICFLVSGGTSR